GQSRVPVRPYFEVLIVDALSSDAEAALRDSLSAMQRAEDPFHYDLVVVPSFEDALIAILFNHNIQAVVIRYRFSHKSLNRLDILKRYVDGVDGGRSGSGTSTKRAVRLGEAIRDLRPELDLYLVTDTAAEEVASSATHIFRRIFYRKEDHSELHPNILRGIAKRYDTPFFTALKEYSRQPTGVFHALPISRGKSIIKSHWIQDMIQFYGANIFLAETSATSGGLDSLLHPSGPLKAAQEMAARAFGARHTSSSPMAHRQRTRWSYRRLSGRATLFSSTATATNRTITEWCSPGPMSGISTPIRSTNTRCTAPCR